MVEITNGGGNQTHWENINIFNSTEYGMRIRGMNHTFRNINIINQTNDAFLFPFQDVGNILIDNVSIQNSGGHGFSIIGENITIYNAKVYNSSLSAFYFAVGSSKNITLVNISTQGHSAMEAISTTIMASITSAFFNITDHGKFDGVKFSFVNGEINITNLTMSGYVGIKTANTGVVLIDDLNFTNPNVSMFMDFVNFSGALANDVNFTTGLRVNQSLIGINVTNAPELNVSANVTIQGVDCSRYLLLYNETFQQSLDAID